MEQTYSNPSNPAAAWESLEDPPFEFVEPGRVPGIVRRLFQTLRHGLGLLAGIHIQRVRTSKARLWRRPFSRLSAAMLRMVIRREVCDKPFPYQLRRRLEWLGPTYIKLGQVMSLREDLLPADVTAELKHLLDRLPAIPFSHFKDCIEQDLGQPTETFFSWISPQPLGSASIAQTHRATTREGLPCIIKVVKPGIRETLERDSRLLLFMGTILHWFLPRYRPKQVIQEFCTYTMKELDLRREADSAETFAANFIQNPGVVFPKIYRQYSGSRVLCMEYLHGVRPDSDAARNLPLENRTRLVDIGAGAIITMLYSDGFFHADLHPGNLLILDERRCGFIDLGMTGRFDEDVRKTMLNYFYSLVMGDARNAARLLSTVADPGEKADPVGFRREVEDICRRWVKAANFHEFSLAQLILQSMTVGARFDMAFPVEMVLMVKALVTFEGVGHLLLPDMDVATISKRHIRTIFFQQFHPKNLIKQAIRDAPGFWDGLARVPDVVRLLQRDLERRQEFRRPEGVWSARNRSLLASSCVLACAILLAAQAHPGVWGGFLAAGVALILKR